MPFFGGEEVAFPSAAAVPEAGRRSPATGSRCTPTHDLDQSQAPRLQDCEGLLSETTSARATGPNNVSAWSDRAEFIERLKRGESPTWALAPAPAPARQENTRIIGCPVDSRGKRRPGTPSRSPNNVSLYFGPPTRSEKQKLKADEGKQDDRRVQEGHDIQRPRSALHSGDFTQEEPVEDISGSSHDGNGAVHAVSGEPWLASVPPRDLTNLHAENEGRGWVSREDDGGPKSASSLSLGTSFVYQPPTSPLVQSESNEDVDAPMQAIGFGSSFLDARHSVKASSRGVLGTSWNKQSSRKVPIYRQERTHPYQAHQPLRSLSSTRNHAPVASASSQTAAMLRSRRPSQTPDVPPLQHASMVGSYEESILHGRMSTTPSKPLDFIAQIGVLGLGDCGARLRCPSHVSLPFPAVFYSYASSSQGRSKMDDGPSPYVGQIDLENGLPPPEATRASRKQHVRSKARGMAENKEHVDPIDKPMDSRDQGRRTAHAQARRTGLYRAPPGGSYRIPEKGQVQIIIKNPNKTAVKLFLVPYDLAGMEAGTKTFVRQRSYSAGPVTDKTATPEDEVAGDRPILRYLVHLHICSPSPGRYYLYKNVRVVFANRVPDGKEKLQNDITVPEPRFSSYKIARAMPPPSTADTGRGADLAADVGKRTDFPAVRVSGGRGEELDGPAEVLDDRYLKRSRGDVGYGGNALAGSDNSGRPGPAEGLLSRRLRSLGVDET